MSREELRSSTLLEVRSVIEVARREELRCLSRNLVEETIRNVMATDYCVVTTDIKNSAFSFVETVITKMNRCGVLDEPLNQGSNHWRQYSIFI